MILSPLLALSLTTVGPSPSQIADEWIEAMNSRQFAKMAEFHRKIGWTPNPEGVASQDWEMARAAGKTVPEKTLSESPTGTERLIRLTDVDVRMVIRVDTTGEKPRLSLRTATPQEAPVESLTEAEFVAKLRAHLRKLAKAGKYSGSAIFAKDGKPLVQFASGLASRGYSVPNRVDTKFCIASMGKLFTTVGIALMKDEGKLDWDDPVGKFLPDYPVEDVRKKVTIRHLLTHRSGLADIFTDAFFEASKDRYKTVASWMSLFENKPLEFEPGTRSRYSNAGFVLLGAILEKLSGKEYFAFLKERVFQPLGMKGTDGYALDQDTPNMAIGYTRQQLSGPPLEGEPMNNLFLHTAKGSPAGGCFSTAPDFVRFAEGIRTGKLLKPSTTEDLLGAKGADGQIGLGFGVRNLPGGETRYGHSGGFPGISTFVESFRKSGYTLVSLTNSDDDSRWIAQWALPRIQNLRR